MDIRRLDASGLVSYLSEDLEFMYEDVKELEGKLATFMLIIPIKAHYR